MARQIQDVKAEEIRNKIWQNSQVSLSYLALLVASGIIASLGLITNAPAVVIGGMIISPLMWPLMRLALAISDNEKGEIKISLAIIGGSVMVGVIIAWVIALVSPVKAINAEILARSSPTLLDLIVALAAGGIATLALHNNRISDSLAGVAIATSLMPPLCAAGIGLAFGSSKVAVGSLLLFFTNIISIIFIALAGFLVVEYLSYKQIQVNRNGLIWIVVALVATSLPLVFLLKTYTFETTVYRQVQQSLGAAMAEVSPEIYIQNVKTTIGDDGEGKTVYVDADVLIPQAIQFSYDQKDRLVSKLKAVLGEEVVLNMHLQTTVGVRSREDVAVAAVKKAVTDEFRGSLAEVNELLVLDSFELNYDRASGNWSASAVVRTDPTTPFTEENRRTIEEQLTAVAGAPVQLSIDTIARVKLKSSSEAKSEEIRKEVANMISLVYPDAVVGAISVGAATSSGETNEQAAMAVTVEVRLPERVKVIREQIDAIQNELGRKFESRFRVVMRVTPISVY